MIRLLLLLGMGTTGGPGATGTGPEAKGPTGTRALNAGGSCCRKSSAGNLEKASFITDSTRVVTCSRIWGLTSLIIRPEFWLMKSLTVLATAGARPSNKLSSCTWALAMSKSMLVRFTLSFWLPGGPTGSMAAEPTPVTPLKVAWNKLIMWKLSKLGWMALFSYSVIINKVWFRFC